jgi:predicted metalloprotease
VYKPSLQTQEQKDAITKALEVVAESKKSPSGGILGDMLNDRWFDVESSAHQLQDINGVYEGAVAFILAHELGHIVLGHHNRLSESLSKASPDDAMCTLRRDFERQADVFALFVLVSPCVQLRYQCLSTYSPTALAVRRMLRKF